ncbi:MAG TPA: hypothetical protein VIJ93_14800 [bacterium]
MTQKNFLTLLIFCLCALSLSPARAEDPIRLNVTDRLLDSFFDLPFGVHQILKTNVLFSQSLKTANAKEMDKALALDINGITRNVLREQFGGKDPDGGFTISGKADGETLEITPWVLLNIQDDGQVLPWMVWEVEYWDLYWNKKKWDGYCIVCLSKPRPIDGKGGWSSNGCELLEQEVKTNARKLLEAARIDLTGGYKKNHYHSIRKKTVWMFDKKPKEIGFDVSEIDPENLMVSNFLDKAAADFFAAGLTGVLLKIVHTNTVLFNGALIIPKDFGETVEVKPSPQTKGN